MLAIPPYAFGVVADNWSATFPGAAFGTLMATGDASAHTKGSVVAIIGSGIAQPAFLISIDIFGPQVAGTDTSALLDIMYDPAGGTSWQVLIPNLLCGFIPVQSSGAVCSMHYEFPLYIPRGSSIGGRWQSIVASASQRPTVVVTLYGGTSKPGFWFGTKVTGIGTDTANSAGLDHAVGSTGAFSSWVSIGGTSNPKMNFITMGVQGSAGTITQNYVVMQYGFGSTKIQGAALRFGTATTETVIINPPHRGCYVDIPAGTQMQVRGAGSDASVEDPSVALYGVS